MKRVFGILPIAAALTCMGDPSAWAGGTESTAIPSPDSAAYAKATAHNPHYEDRTLWPTWVEKTDFYKQDWPKARVLVWAHTDKSTRGLDLTEAKHWRRENGEPAKRGPDEHTDIIFPRSPNGQRYQVSGHRTGCHARHMTVERDCRGWLKNVHVHGNVWLKKGGSWHGLLPHGPENTFMRNDSAKVDMAANKIAVNKPPQRSIEWIGKWNLGDELDLFSGRFIVAPDSTFMPGDRSRFHVYPKATLVLTSGSAFYKRGNQYWAHDMEVKGTVLAGTPDRPLTRDCTIALSFKAKDAIDHPKFKRSDLGLLLYRQGRIAVHSAAPKSARLVFRCNDRPVSSGGDLVPQRVRKMPHGIDMLLLGEADFDGVVFKDVLAGGIKMPDPAARKDWKHVTFAEGNFGPEEKLFARYEGPTDIEMRDTGIAKRLAKQAKQSEAADDP